MPRSKNVQQGPSEFSMRLSKAIADRGLTLHRLQAHLAQRGLTVSVATLSYWSNGRSAPSRATSMDVVVALEAILQLEPGTLTGALVEATPLQLAWDKDRLERLRATVRTANLPNADHQRLLMAHYEATITADRHQSSSTTTLAVQAKQAGATGWSITVDRAPGQQVTASAGLGIRLGRVIEVDENATIFEFLFREPLDRGQACRTTHHLDFSPVGPECQRVGYALNRSTGLLVLTCTFAGPPPRRVVQCFTPAGSGATREVVAELPPGPVAECVIATPGLGLHTIEWEW